MLTCNDVLTAIDDLAPRRTESSSDKAGASNGLRWGDGRAEVRGIAVAWCLEKAIIEKAIAQGLNMIVAHEPTVLYGTGDVSEWYQWPRMECNPINLERIRLLTEQGMCVAVAHTIWDVQPELGIMAALPKAYGFTEMVSKDGLIPVYRVPRTTLGELARKVKLAMKLDSVRISGDPAKPVETVAIGCGRMSRVFESARYQGADAAILGELAEHDALYAREAGVGLIEATHIASETFGFRNMAAALAKRFPGIPVTYIENEPAFRTIS